MGCVALPTKASGIQQQLRELDLDLDREIIHLSEGVHTARAATVARGRH